MSHLSFMEKLLEGVEVEWKSLGEVSEVRMCKRILKNQTSHEGEIPFYKIGTFGKEPDAYIPQKLFEEYKAKYNYPKVGEILISASGTIGRTVIFDGKDAYFQDSNIVWIENDERQVLNKYLFYFYQIAKWGVAEGGTIQRLYNENLRKLQIPIPPLAIQAEIVRILDAFTAHTAELTAELTARKKQCNYYRDQLLSFEEGEVEWKTLNEVCSSISAGGDLPENYAKGQTKPTDEFPYPIYANATGDKGLYGFTDGYKIESDAVTISARGAKIGYHTTREGKFTPIIRLITLVPNKSVISSRYLNYILDITPIGGTDGGIPQLTVPTVKKISIPVSASAEQARIVAILDKFDALTNSITEGLPREISLRQQQYEYYRDLLLSFPKPAPEASLESVEKKHG